MYSPNEECARFVLAHALKHDNENCTYVVNALLSALLVQIVVLRMLLTFWFLFVSVRHSNAATWWSTSGSFAGVSISGDVAEFRNGTRFICIDRFWWVSCHFLAHVLPLLLLHFLLICRFVFAPVLIREERCYAFRIKTVLGTSHRTGSCAVLTLGIILFRSFFYGTFVVHVSLTQRLHDV